jgi:hypothetical protein
MEWKGKAAPETEEVGNVDAVEIRDDLRARQ